MLCAARFSGALPKAVVLRSRYLELKYLIHHTEYRDNRRVVVILDGTPVVSSPEVVYDFFRSVHLLGKFCPLF